MTIRNFTFFSPTGTEFPVSSNADAKLYLMLSGMNLDAYKRKDWEEPVDTALNRQYSNTSLVVGGRYFELEGETVALLPSTDNYVHANVDLTNPTAPVGLSVETADNSNSTDINNGTGVLKHCFDIVTTDTMGVTGLRVPKQVTILDELTVATGVVNGITINNGWYEEKLGDNYYRWTRTFSVTTAINQGAGSALQQSGLLTIPTPPQSITMFSRFVTAGQAPWSCWAMYFPGANAFRLFSYASRSAGEVRCEAIIYGSKN